jgi:hypothetical protein
MRIIFLCSKMELLMERVHSEKSLSVCHTKKIIDNSMRHLTPRILEPLNPLGGDFTQSQSYWSPYGFIYPETILEMIQYD